MATFLDESEVRILTGQVRHGAQVRALRGMGIEHVVLRTADFFDSPNVNIRQLKILTEAFGSASLSDMRPVHIYQYVEARSAKGSRPPGDHALEPHLQPGNLIGAIQWGLIDNSLQGTDTSTGREAP